MKGPTVFAGYSNRADATAEAMDADGFFYTGDIAAIEPTGEVRIVGRRATDLIKTGGYKVGAGEVDAALLEHAAVREAAVIGVPDEDLGERIVAFVVAASGATPRPEGSSSTSPACSRRTSGRGSSSSRRCPGTRWGRC